MSTLEPTVISTAADTDPGVCCRDCGSSFPGGANFCPQCGQETRIRLPRVFDFLREAADETIGFSGRLPRTLGLLLFRPGRLTVEYIDGRRQRYVRPMRLYLSVSLVFFALLGIATSDIGWIHVPSLDSSSIQQEIQEAEQDKLESTKTAAEEAAAAGGSAAVKPGLPVVDLSDLGHSRKKAEPKPADKRTAGVEAAPAGASTAPGKESKPGVYSDIPWLDHRIDKYKDMPRDQLFRTVMQSVQANAPYAVFILMPLAAFWYQLFYVFRHRRYAEHLLHAVHLHCFAFCIGSISLLPWVDGWRGWLFWLLGVYALLAERRVYGSGWLRAGFGTFIGSILYFVGVCITATALAILALAF
jgi:hypothetical protein